MGNQEAAALLIKNIEMFEQATLLSYEIGEKVDDAVNQKIKEWVSNFSADWLFDDTTPSTICFTHKSCVRQEEEDWIAYFGVAPEYDEDKQDSCWLASYCGKGKCRWGISFELNHASFCVSQSKLKKHLQQEKEKYLKLQEIGFVFQGTYAGWWFLPFQLDAGKLASSYAKDAIEDALDPIDEALNKVKEAWPEFERLVDATAKEFPNSGS